MYTWLVCHHNHSTVLTLALLAEPKIHEQYLQSIDLTIILSFFSFTKLADKNMAKAVGYYIYLVKRCIVNSSHPRLVAAMHATIMVINAALE